MANAPSTRAARVRSTASLTMLAALVLMTVMLLPFALSSVLFDISDETNDTYRLFSDRAALAPDQSVRVRIDLLQLVEVERAFSMRVTGHHVCAGCTNSISLTFYSALEAEDDAEALPTSEVVTYAPGTANSVQMIKLPVYGEPIRFPFDTYTLALGLVVSEVAPSGAVRVLSPEEAQRRVVLTVRSFVPREQLRPPYAITNGEVEADDRRIPYVTIQEIELVRPLYLRMLTIMLVILIAAAAAYAVFMRPLRELVINSGALVLGVWGVRSILVPIQIVGLTAVDLSLTAVILFLLAAITVRTAYLIEQETGVRLFFSRFRRATPPSVPESPPPPQ
jgi:hypothetical protein